jgi:HPt (histidine-containing phosphotransfer) domain-containing protein
MTDLSPAARAVHSAFHKAANGQAWTNTAIAAALETAADELKMPDDLGLYSNAFWAGYTSAATKLLAIAAELDPPHK